MSLEPVASSTAPAVSERAAQRNLGPVGPSEVSYLTSAKEASALFRSGESPSLQEGVLQLAASGLNASSSIAAVANAAMAGTTASLRVTSSSLSTTAVTVQVQPNSGTSGASSSIPVMASSTMTGTTASCGVASSSPSTTAVTVQVQPNSGTLSTSSNVPVMASSAMKGTTSAHAQTKEEQINLIILKLHPIRECQCTLKNGYGQHLFPVEEQNIIEETYGNITVGENPLTEEQKRKILKIMKRLRGIGHDDLYEIESSISQVICFLIAKAIAFFPHETKSDQELTEELNKAEASYNSLVHPSSSTSSVSNSSTQDTSFSLISVQLLIFSDLYQIRNAQLVYEESVGLFNLQKAKKLTGKLLLKGEIVFIQEIHTRSQQATFKFSPDELQKILGIYYRINNASVEIPSPKRRASLLDLLTKSKEPEAPIKVTLRDLISRKDKRTYLLVEGARMEFDGLSFFNNELTLKFFGGENPTPPPLPSNQPQSPPKKGHKPSLPSTDSCVPMAPAKPKDPQSKTDG